MSIRATITVFGSATVLAAAALLACSSSSKNSGGPSNPDSGQPTSNGDSGTKMTGDGGGTTTTDTGSVTPPPSDGGQAEDCESPPKLYPATAPGVYCPYSGVDGGKTLTCAAGQHCCETPESANTPSTCNAAGTACAVAMSTDWQCLGALDCMALDAGTPVCCGNGTMMPISSCNVTWQEPSGFTASTCAASCAAPLYTMCYSSADCTAADAGTTCTASKAEGSDFGYCTP